MTRYPLIVEVAAGWLAALIVAACLYAASSCVYPSPAHAELYVTGLAGWNMPHDFTGFHAEYSWQGRQFEDALKLQNGYAIGGKIGYSPKAFPWIALEVEALQSWPNQKEQSFVQFSRPPGGSGGWQVNSGTLAGTHWEMLSVGPNLILRHQINESWQAFTGGGIPIFFGGSYGGASQVPGFGVTFLAGLRYTLDDAGKYRAMIQASRTSAKLTYKQVEMDGQINGFTGHYQTTMILVGIERAFAF